MSPIDAVAPYTTQVTVRRYSAQVTEAAAAVLGRPACDSDLTRLGLDPYGVSEIGNPANRIVTIGWNAVRSRLLSTTPVWSPSSGGTGACGIGVGSSTTPDNTGDVDLAGTNRSYKQLDDGYPFVETGYIKLKATFTAAEANHLWEEYGWIVPGGGAAAMSGAAVTSKPSNMILFNRKSPAALGTKTNGETWSWEYWISLA